MASSVEAASTHVNPLAFILATNYGLAVAFGSHGHNFWHIVFSTKAS